MADYTSYYDNQVGTGLTVFTGPRYQRGHGFFGNLFSRIGVPLLKYLGKTALETGVNIGQDVLDGNNLSQSVKTNLNKTARTVAQTALNRGRQFAQTGSGRKRKLMQSFKKNKKVRRSKKKPVKRKTAKRKVRDIFSK